MNIEQATQIADILGTYNKHFDECIAFLNLKQQKVLADDLNWLHDSLTEEQRLAMVGSSLETKRLELMKTLGYENHTSAQILEICPDEARGRLKLECVNLQTSIDKIKVLNADILEMVDKKLESAEEYLKKTGVTGPGFYDTAGGKVRLSDPENDIIGNM
ncbi:MAG: flagellar export chaperone FlgN [Oscillospiraceae bacterium]|nr:flagellar export chaperone FlgN [Oscillospiraceae bacterium]